MKNFPRIKVYRALLRHGLITKGDVPKVRAKLERDRDSQRSILRLWRERRVYRRKRMRDILSWVWENREELLTILGVVASLADEEPQAAADSDPKPEATPKPSKPAEAESEDDTPSEEPEDEDKIDYDLGITE